MTAAGNTIAGYTLRQSTRKQRAEELAEQLPRVTVVCGNGTQHDLLIEEGIEAMDAFVAADDFAVKDNYSSDGHIAVIFGFFC